MKIRILIMFVFVTLSTMVVAQTGGHHQYGVFAPKDAYLKGSKFPYYGSENA